MDDAYDFVSGHGRSQHARQMYYDVRKLIQEDTDKPLESNYFTQTLLRDYQANTASRTGTSSFDDRGHFNEPHTKLPTVGLGTVERTQLLERRYVRQTLDVQPGAFCFQRMVPRIVSTQFCFAKRKDSSAL